MRYCQEKGIVCQYAGTNMHCRLSGCTFPKESLYPTASRGGHLMDIEKLIHCLQCCARVDAHNIGCDDCGLEYCGPECQQLCGTAATALSTLQAENEKLWAELEKVKAERDAAVSWAQKYTESIDMPCVACKHNTGDYVCTAICGNCGPMGAESCKWEFDFSGELKED